MKLTKFQFHYLVIIGQKSEQCKSKRRVEKIKARYKNMNKKLIKRSLSTLFTSMSGLIGTWIYILMFSNRSGAVLVGGIIDSFSLKKKTA